VKRSRSKVWTYQKGEFFNTVTATERTDRRRIVEVRWWVGSLNRFQRRSLRFSIRDENGAIVEELEREAVRQTQAIYDALMAGRPISTNSAPAEKAALTLRAGFDLATAVPTGLYVLESEHLRDVRRAVRDILDTIGKTERGDDRTWDVLNNAAVRELWIGLARRFKATGQGGPVWTERCVVVLLQISGWLAAEERIARPLAMKKTWREQLRREWEQFTSSRITRSTPRHSEEEIRSIFAALDRPEVDPRIALAIELGAEARLGQVSRLMRSHVDLSAVGVFGLGRVTVHGAGKKFGVQRDLAPEERAAIDRALSGYLKALEEAFQNGIRADYPMFPSGRLRYDVSPSRMPKRKKLQLTASTRRAKLSVSNKPLGKWALNDFFHELERLAGVEPVPGRGWYGIRRRATDVYEDYEKDERVLNDQTGHKKSETRREVYQERDREAIWGKWACPDLMDA
jgi:integrase